MIFFFKFFISIILLFALNEFEMYNEEEKDYYQTGFLVRHTELRRSTK